MIIGRSTRWTTKPPVGTQIDFGHPLAHRLRAAYLLNEAGGVTVRNAVDGSVSDAFVGAVTWTVAARGYGLQGPNTSTAGVVCRNIRYAGAPGAYSLFSVATGTSAGVQSILDNDDDSVQRYFQHRLNSGAPEFIAFNAASSPFFATASALSANQLKYGFSLASVTDGATAKMYVDGLLGASATITGTPRTPGPNLRLMNSISDGAQQNGVLYLAYVWDRALTASEVQQLHVNPYALLAVRRRYAAPPASMTPTAGAAPCFFVIT